MNKVEYAKELFEKLTDEEKITYLERLLSIQEKQSPAPVLPETDA